MISIFMDDTTEGRPMAKKSGSQKVHRRGRSSFFLTLLFFLFCFWTVSGLNLKIPNDVFFLRFYNSDEENTLLNYNARAHYTPILSS